MAPFTRLARRPSSYGSTIVFRPSITPFAATWRAARNQYWLAAAVTAVALSGEALNIVISGVPFSPGQVRTQFFVSAYMSLAILGLMILVLGFVMICRRQEARVPVPPFTLAAKISYLAGSGLLDDFDGSEWESERARDKRLRLLGRQYSLQERTAMDGSQRTLVDIHGDDLLEGLS